MTGEQRSQVVAEARTWLQTPFHHRGQLKRVGVDCGHLVRLVYNAALGLELPEPPEYSTQWNLHRSDELYLDYVQQYADPVETPEAADLLVFKVGRTFSHGAILMEAGTDLVLHAMQGSGVVYSNYRQSGLMKYAEFRAFTLKETLWH